MRSRLRLPSTILNNLAFALGLAILGVLAWQGGRTQAALLQHGESARASLELIAETRGTLSALQDIETGVRGFIITGDAAYLEPFHAGREELRIRRTRLGQLVGARGGGNAAWFATLDRLIDQRLDIAEGNVESRRLGGQASATERLRVAGGKEVMDRLRTQLDALERAERDRLAMERRAVQRQYERGHGQLVIGGTIVGLLLVGGLLAMNRNLRARRRLALDAHARRAFLRSVVDADENAIFVRDPSGCFVLCNRAFGQLLGMEPARIEGRRPGEIDGIDGVATMLEGDAELLDGTDALQVERRVTDATGRSWWLQLTKQRLDLPDGTRAILSVAVDISARREIAELKSEFVSTVSHELRTPLTAIRGALGMLIGGMAGEIPGEARPLLEIAHKNSERLVLLINDILDIEKLDAGRVQMQLRSVPVRHAVQQALDQIAPFAAQFDVALTLDGDTRAEVLADPDRFAQIMANLLSNAIKYSPRRGTVTVDISRRDDVAVVGVTDGGAGIPAAFQGRVFERFAQADSTDARRIGGTGLGLSITRALVEQHGGRIRFDSVPGRTRFEVELPLASSAPATPAPTAASACTRLLVVDDDATSATHLATILRGQGYVPVLASDGAEARASLATTTFGGVIISLALAGEDALGFVRGLRSNPDHQHLPVLAVGLRPGDGDDIEGGAIGIVDWLRKPFDAARVVEAVRNAIDGAHRVPQVLHVEDDEDLRTLIAGLLEQERLELHAAPSLKAARAALLARRHDLVILDLMLPDGDGAALLDEMARISPPPRVIIFSAKDAELPETSVVLRRLVKARQGATDLAALIRQQLEQWPATPTGGDA